MKRTLLPFLALTAFLLFFTSNLPAQHNVRSVQISFVQGNVLIDHGKGEGNQPAITNMPITSGTVLRTGKGGLAEIEFENGSSVRMAEETALWFPSMTRTDSGPETTLNQESGTIYLDYRHAGGNVFLLRDLRMQFMRNDVHLRISLAGGQASIAILDGTLPNSAGLHVGKGQTLHIDLKTNTIVAKTKGIDPAVTDRWDRDRQKYLSAQHRPDVLPPDYSLLRNPIGRAPTDDRWTDPVWSSAPDQPNPNSGRTVPAAPPK